MQVLYWPDDQVFAPKPCACTLGVFDGVHLGHRRVLRQLCAAADALAVAPVVITFDRHPAAETPRPAPPLLSSLSERLDLIAEEGIGACLVIRFTPEVACMAAEHFVDRVLCDLLGAKAVVVGWNTRFGHERKGTPELLVELGRQRGFGVTVCEPLEVDGHVVSSTRIRNELLAGHVGTANSLLGREYRVAGKVVRGDARGRQLGYPTANLDVVDQLVPGDGVYVTLLRMGDQSYESVTSISKRMTFYEEQNAPSVIEAHCLDYAGDLYERTCELVFIKYLREQRKFPTPALLARTIGEDVAFARKVFEARR